MWWVAEVRETSPLLPDFIYQHQLVWVRKVKNGWVDCYVRGSAFRLAVSNARRFLVPICKASANDSRQVAVGHLIASTRRG